MPRTKATSVREEKPKRKRASRAASAARSPRKRTAHHELSRDPLPVLPDGPSLTHGHSIHDYAAPHRRRDRRQHLFVISSISLIMTVIIIAWIMNLNRIIEADMPVPVPAAANQVDFATLKQQLSTSLAEVKGNLSSLSDLAAPTNAVTPSASPAVIPSSTVTPATLPSTLPQ